MTSYIAFLRAVNVGKRRVAMAQLRDEVIALDLDDVVTYVNSGNVAFTTSANASGLESAVEARLEQAFGFEVPTFVRTLDDVARIVERRPFGAVHPGDTHMVVFLRKRATAGVKRAAEAMTNDTDHLIAEGRELHWLIRGSFMDSTLKAKDWRTLGDEPTTNRNTTMLAKLVGRLV